MKLLKRLRSSVWSEHWTFNPGVGGSNPLGAILFLFKMSYSKNFDKILLENKIDSKIIKFKESTKTSQDAADQLNIDIAKIGKSIIFKTESFRLILVIASGKNRIDEEKLEKILNEKLIKVTGEEIKKRTGYAIGGIPPFGHKEKLRVFIDKDLLQFETIFCAAGTPNSVFEISLKDILNITKGEIVDIKR